MAVDLAAVADALETTVELLPAETADEIAAVVAYAAERYDQPADPELLAVYEHALVQQVKLRLISYRAGAAGDDRPQRPLGRFDWSVKDQLTDFLKAGYVA